MYIYKIFTDNSLRRLNCEVHATSTSLSILHSLPSLVEFQLIVNLKLWIEKLVDCTSIVGEGKVGGLLSKLLKSSGMDF